MERFYAQTGYETVVTCVCLRMPVRYPVVTARAIKVSAGDYSHPGVLGHTPVHLRLRLSVRDALWGKPRMYLLDLLVWVCRRPADHVHGARRRRMDHLWDR